MRSSDHRNEHVVGTGVNSPDVNASTLGLSWSTLLPLPVEMIHILGFYEGDSEFEISWKKMRNRKEGKGTSYWGHEGASRSDLISQPDPFPLHSEHILSAITLTK